MKKKVTLRQTDILHYKEELKDFLHLSCDSGAESVHYVVTFLSITSSVQFEASHKSSLFDESFQSCWCH